jgi:hypothetical protein
MGHARWDGESCEVLHAQEERGRLRHPASPSPRPDAGELAGARDILNRKEQQAFCPQKKPASMALFDQGEPDPSDE